VAVAHVASLRGLGKGAGSASTRTTWH
jgi:hypothetical protein